MNFEEFLIESHWKGSSHYDMSQRGSKPNEKYKSGVRHNPAGDEKDMVHTIPKTTGSYTYQRHYHKVPYNEKHIAKNEFGMKWDAEEKHWYHTGKDIREGKHKGMPEHWEYSHTKNIQTSY